MLGERVKILMDVVEAFICGISFMQRTAYDGWKTFASQTRLAKSISEQSQELDALVYFLLRIHTPFNGIQERLN